MNNQHPINTGDWSSPRPRIPSTDYQNPYGPSSSDYDSDSRYPVEYDTNFSNAPIKTRAAPYGYESSPPLMSKEQAINKSTTPQNRSKLDDCGYCTKYLMITFNILVFIPALAVCGTGVFLVVDRNYMSIIVGNALFSVAAYFLIVAGAIVIITATLGCCGATLGNRCMLVTYFLLLVGMALILTTAGVLAIIFRTKIGEEIVVFMQDNLKNNYGVLLDQPYNRAVTDAWDNAQSRLYCCSVRDNGWGTYRASKWYAEQPGQVNAGKIMVPISCCARDQYDNYIDVTKCQTWIRGPPATTTGVRNEALFYSGCYEQGKAFLYEHTGVIIGLGIGVALSLAFGIITSIIFYRYTE